jgi:hypothetical protein
VSVARSADRRARDRERGQGLVELSLLIPVFLLLLLGMLEFGFVFDHNISLSYATREGARVGAALVNGGGPLGCGGGNSPNAASVDPAIMTAVDRVLNSPGSLIDRSQVAEIRIYNANASGGQIGSQFNRWIYSGGTFIPDASAQNWNACNRTYAGTPTQSIGISIRYSYVLRTPLAAIWSFFGGGAPVTLSMADRTVMAMNPLG